jgi:GGDEF domain-containing protein
MPGDHSGLAVVDKPIAAPGTETLEAWKQFGCLLFDASAEQPLEALQERLKGASPATQNGTGGAQILIDATALAHSIERYSHQLQQRANTERETVRGYLRAFLDHLECVHTEVAETAQLAQMRGHLEAGQPEDPEAMRLLISGCLASLQQSYREKQSSQEAVIASLRGRVQTSESSAAQVPTAASTAQVPALAVVSDPCTGLPSKSEAEAALQRVAGAAQYYIAIFYVHRVNLINSRFGEEIGNEIILYCSQHIATSLIRPSDSLFRWSGPAFVAILERDESPQAVAGEVRRVVSVPLSRFFDNSSRTMYLPIRLTAETLPAANQDCAAVSGQIAKFIHSASRVG